MRLSETRSQVAGPLFARASHGDIGGAYDADNSAKFVLDHQPSNPVLLHPLDRFINVAILFDPDYVGSHSFAHEAVCLPLAEHPDN
jgi:hypothetical protein